jgi:hypothetical protein
MATPEELAKEAADKLAAEQAEEARLAAEEEANKNKTQAEKDQDMIAKLVKEKVDAELKAIKDKLDGSYAQRDEALRKLAEKEQKEKDEMLKRLEEEGKHKEVYELKLAEEKAKREALEKANVELTRDVTVRDVLKGYSFKNDNAADVGYREVVSQLVQNDKGDWVHRSGVSIKDFVKAFATDENNSYLFAVKHNSGDGNNNGNFKNENNQDNNQKKSLFKMTQAEVLAMAERGELPNQKQ